ncbi:PAS domain S-box protein [uncultured Draconibacterium sp.]|uniref:PAS domain S-box protein n=1 Tax=uncultured Draconibacterium sp. TaxID=1573823 RepID=UPI0029C7E1EC|nr:PAS domain S-box protein [uncultured Draconibacterium sp.]
MGNINKPKLSYEELLAQNIQLKNQVQEIKEKSKKVEDKYLNIIESSPLGVHFYSLEEDGKLIFEGYNKSAETILGVELKGLIGKTIEEAFPSLAQTEIPSGYKKTARTGKDFFTNHIDYDFGKIKGAYEVMAYQVFQHKIAVNFSNITKRLKNELELTESQQKFKSLFDNIEEGVALHKMIFDGDNKIIDFVWVDVNPKYEKLTQLKKKDLIGKKGKDVISNIEEKWYNLYAEVVLTGIPKTVIEYSEYLDKYWEVKAFRPQEGHFAVAMSEITEKAMARSLLSNSESKYRALYENAPLPYQSLDINGNIIDVNPAWLSTLGYKSEEVLGKNYADFLHPDWKNHFESNFPAFKKRGYVSDVQFKIKHKKGHYLDISFEGYIGEHPDGRFKQTYCVFKDITENKLIEEALKKNQYYLSKAQEMGKIGTWERNIVNNKRIWNKQNYKNFGVKFGTPITDELFLNCIHPDDRQYVTNEWTAATKGKPYDIEHRVVTDGKIKWLRGKANINFDENGKAVSAVGFSQDISKFKESELKLKENERKFRILADSTNDWEYWMDENNKYVFISPSCKRITGYSEEEFYKNPDLFIELIKEDYKDEVFNHYHDLNKKQPRYISEFPIINKNNKEIWIEHSCIPIFDEEGKFLGIRGNNRDITERKIAERELLKSKEIAERSELEFRALYDNSPDMYASVFPETDEIFMCNDTLLEKIGYGRKEIIGTPVLKVFHQDSIEEAKKAFEVFREKGIINNKELIIAKKNGEKIYVSLNVTPIRDKQGKTLYYMYSWRDISDRIKLRQKQLRDRQLLNETGRLAKIGGWEMDVETMTYYYTQETKSIYGLPIDADPPKGVEGLKYYTKEAQEKLGKLLQTAIEKGNKYDVELPFKNAQGKHLWVRTIGNPEKKNGKVTRLYGTFQDITAQKLHETELIKAKEQANSSLQQIKVIQANTPNVIWKWDFDKDGNFTNIYISKAADEFLALPEGSIHNSMDKFSTYILPEYLVLVNDAIKNAVKNPNELISLEYEVKKANGKLAWFSSSGKVIPENKKLTIYGSTIDITEKKQNELKLKQSDRVFNLSLDMFCIAGFDGYFKYLNPAWERTLGWSIEELLSKPWLDFVHPDDADNTENIKSVIVDGKEVYKFENRYICKDGTIKWLSWKSQPFPKENIMIGAVRDITEAKRTENELIQAKEKVEENEKKFRQAFDHAGIGMALVSLKGNLLKINQSACQIWGYTEVELLNMSFQEITHPDDLKKDLELRHKCIDGKINHYNISKRYIKKSGETMWAKLHVSLVRNNLQQPQFFISQIEDITKQVIYEQELIKAKEKAEESDRLKSAFLANMSHEIRTPMNGILGFTELLQEAELSVKNQKNYIDIIEKSGNRLLNTVNDIIEISKIESGEIKVTKSKVDIISLLDILVAFFKHEAKNKNIDIVLQNNIDGNDLTITSDKNKLSSILSNLIKNAIKYTNEGTINVGLKIENNQVLFSCQDTGIGIPKNRQKAIFNRFEQADIEDKHAHQGSGLGLAIVKSYVEMLDGRIWVESETGKGSAFYVLLPHEHEEKKEQIVPLEVKSSDFGMKNINVLIVEDDVISLMHLSEILKAKVKNIISARNGLEAIDACKNNSGIDLILMDFKMPVMDGIEATKEIRRFNKDIVIIAQTAYALEGDREKARDAGCNDYISKPINKDILFEVINKYFNIHAESIT